MIQDYQENNCVFLRGRTNKTVITVPEKWEEDIDLLSLSVHITPIGADQKLFVKRVKGREIHLQTNGMPADCYYLIIGQFLDKEEVVV